MLLRATGKATKNINSYCNSYLSTISKEIYLDNNNESYYYDYY